MHIGLCSPHWPPPSGANGIVSHVAEWRVHRPGSGEGGASAARPAAGVTSPTKGVLDEACAKYGRGAGKVDGRTGLPAPAADPEAPAAGPVRMLGNPVRTVASVRAARRLWEAVSATGLMDDCRLGCDSHVAGTSGMARAGELELQ